MMEYFSASATPVGFTPNIHVGQQASVLTSEVGNHRETQEIRKDLSIKQIQCPFPGNVFSYLPNLYMQKYVTLK